MADVSIDATITSLATTRVMRGVVFTTASIGYFFYMDNDGTFGYTKTADGGATWGAQVEIYSAGNVAGADAWFDQWTPTGTGTLIHLWYFSSSDDIVFHRTLDTATDTLGTQHTVFTGTSTAPARGVFVSGTKTRSGYLYAAFDIDAGAEKGLYRSIDAGVNWTLLSGPFVEATIDQCLLFPASGTGDNNDCWAVYQDADADELTLKMWDSSAAGEVESAVIQAMAENVADGTGQYGFSGSIRHSDGHLIVASMSAYDSSTNHQIFDVICPTATTFTITEKTAIASATDDHYRPQVFIDQNTNVVYVFYNGKRDGSETLATATKVYYTLSTDGGVSWTAGDTAYMEGTAGVVVQVYAPIMGPRLYAGWRVGTTLLGNAVNSVSLATAPAGQRLGLGLRLGL